MTVDETINHLQFLKQAGRIKGNTQLCLHTDFDTTVLIPATDDGWVNKIMLIGWAKRDNAGDKGGQRK